jgi:hypothetical protein
VAALHAVQVKEGSLAMFTFCPKGRAASIG